MNNIYKGKFRLDSHRDILEFHSLDGEFFDVITDKKVPLETSVEASFSNRELIDWNRDELILAAPPPNTIVALAKILNFGEEITPADIENTAAAANRVQNEYRRMGLTNIIVKSHVINQYDGPRSLRGFQWSFLTNHLREVDSDTNYTHYHGWGGYEGGICGRAWVGGSQGWTYGTCNYTTIIHELGHNFGLSHAGTPTSEYGERDTYMGSGNRRFDINAPQLDVLGVIDEEDISTIQSNEDGGTFFLTQASKNTLSLPPNVGKLVIVKPRDGEYKTVAISYYDEDVRIHTPSNSVATRYSRTHVQEKLRVGQVATFDNITVEYLQHKDGVAKVLVKNGVENVSDPQPWPEFVIPENSHRITSDLSGLWRNANWSAQGFHVRYLGLGDRNELFVGWLSWNDFGDPEWFWSVMQIDDNNYASGDLRTTREATVVGKCDMYFVDGHHGTFRATADKVGHFVFPVTRLSVSVINEINGFYGLGNGIGLSIERTTLNTVAGFIYTYQGNVASFNRNKPEWQMVLGEWGKPLIVYDVTGGVRGTKTDYKTIPAGTLKIDKLASDKIITWDGNDITVQSLA